MDTSINQKQNEEIQKFKSILEYFVKHMAYVCSKISKNKIINERAEIIIKKDVDNVQNRLKEELNIIDGAKSGQGYSKNQIQDFMEEQAEVKDSNSFSCLNSADQKICISIDLTGGYKGGSYLHLVTISDSQKITNETAGTNINPVFEEGIEENKKFSKFHSLEVGPSKNKPTYVFPKLEFTFYDLGLGIDETTEEQEFNLRTFFSYFIEMRKAELMGPLTYKGKEQLLATYNMILTGAPGTGKTWSAKNIASWIICGKSYERLESTEKLTFKQHCEFVQFHPSYDYTDFVEGLRPIEMNSTSNNSQQGEQSVLASSSKEIGFELKNGVFKKFCEKALMKYNAAHKYVFIIDEINRGELSKIFGELFYSIDPGYRGVDGAVLTQYANMVSNPNEFDKTIYGERASSQVHGHFFIPDNVYIIGTMNDIDRSVESMDFAMRRRFSFIEVKANEREDMWTEDWKDLAKACMEAINKEIEKIPGLSSAYHIGPAYFKKLNDYEPKDSPDFFKLWDNHLQGIIFEYLRGKKDVEDSIAKIQKIYLEALINAIKARFSTKGKWGKYIIKFWKKMDQDQTDSSIIVPYSRNYKEYKKKMNSINDGDIDNFINSLSKLFFPKEDNEIKNNQNNTSSFEHLEALKKSLTDKKSEQEKTKHLLAIFVTQFKKKINDHLEDLRSLLDKYNIKLAKTESTEIIQKLTNRMSYLMEIGFAIESGKLKNDSISDDLEEDDLEEEAT